MHLSKNRRVVLVVPPVAVFDLSPYPFLGEVLSSQIEDPQKNKR